MIAPTRTLRPTHTGDLLVTVDVAVRTSGGMLHLRAQHGVRGDRVTAVTQVGAAAVEIDHLDLGGWAAELARTVTVEPSRTAGSAPAAGLVLPWELLVGTGAALARHRPDVYDALVARAGGSCLADGRVLGLADRHEQLRRLHAATGRMRATGAGVGARGRHLGLAGWVHLAGRWFALVPAADGGRAMVRVEPRRPADLATEAARWLRTVRR
jgi:hypothetical protein